MMKRVPEARERNLFELSRWKEMYFTKESRRAIFGAPGSMSSNVFLIQPRPLLLAGEPLEGGSSFPVRESPSSEARLVLGELLEPQDVEDARR